MIRKFLIKKGLKAITRRMARKEKRRRRRQGFKIPFNTDFE